MSVFGGGGSSVCRALLRLSQTLRNGLVQLDLISLCCSAQMRDVEGGEGCFGSWDFLHGEVDASIG